MAPVVISYTCAKSSAADIAAHLSRCDPDFIPPLSQRVVIADYAEKIHAKALRFEAWDGGRLVGLFAIYANDPGKTCAFVTSVSVDVLYRRRQIADQIISRGVAEVRRRGFKQIDLQVGVANQGAQSLYARHGFVPQVQPGDMSDTLAMHLLLEEAR